MSSDGPSIFSIVFLFEIMYFWPLFLFTNTILLKSLFYFAIYLFLFSIVFLIFSCFSFSSSSSSYYAFVLLNLSIISPSRFSSKSPDMKFPAWICFLFLDFFSDFDFIYCYLQKRNTIKNQNQIKLTYFSSVFYASFFVLFDTISGASLLSEFSSRPNSSSSGA